MDNRGARKLRNHVALGFEELCMHLGVDYFSPSIYAQNSPMSLYFPEQEDRTYEQARLYVQNEGLRGLQLATI